MQNYYVYNDIFRYVHEVEGEEAAANAANPQPDPGPGLTNATADNFTNDGSLT